MSVSDDECPRYRLSALLSSTSLVQTFLLASSFHVLLFRKNAIYDTILSLVRSLCSYVLADDVLSSSYSFPHFLVLGHSPFPSSRLHTLSVESLSPSADRDSFIHRESSQCPSESISYDYSRGFLPWENHDFSEFRTVLEILAIYE